MRLVAGRYAITAELGRGGMGVVWRAEDQVLGRQVALKELATPPGTTPAHLERVLREARTAGRLNDPGVVTVYDVVAEQGATFIVMELVVAPTLADVIGREGPLPNERVAALGLQVLGALESAHAAGIVHRDVKPSNIMVLPGDRVKLADFGIARAMDDPALTQTGGVMGSPGYMAPELFAGTRPAPASDLWSLGATLFHAAEGRAPFQRTTTAATLHAIMYERPVPELCRGPLAEAVQGLLTQSVPDRLDAPALRRLLETAAAYEAPTQAVDPGDLPTVVFEPVTALVMPPPPTTVDWDPPKPRRRRAAFVLGGVAVAVVAALGAVFLFKPGNAPSATAGQSLAAADTSSQPQPQPTSSPSTAPASTSAVPSTVPPSGPPVLPGAATIPPQPSSAPPGGGQPAKPDPVKVALVRYHHADGGHFSATKKVGPPPGFTSEGLLGSLVTTAEPGTLKLYACRVTGQNDWFSSVDGGCEGQQSIGFLGYLYSKPPSWASSRPVYRCNAGADHFDSLAAGCEGKTKEFMLGYLIL